MPPVARLFPSRASWAGRVPRIGGRVTPRQRMADTCAPFVAGRGHKSDELRNRQSAEGSGMRESAGGAVREAGRSGARKWGRHCCRPHSHRSLSPAFPLRESPARLVRRLCRPALAPASGSVRRREGCKAPFLPAWRFRDRNSRGGSVLHLAAARPKPRRFHPRRAGSSGLPVAGLPLLFSAGCASIRRSPRTDRLQGRAVFATASKLSGLTVPVRF